MLINCQECNKEISHTADSCPGCGWVIPVLIKGAGEHSSECGCLTLRARLQAQLSNIPYFCECGYDSSDLVRKFKKLQENEGWVFSSSTGLTFIGWIVLILTLMLILMQPLILLNQ